MSMFNGRDEEFMFPKPETIDSDVARENQVDYATDAFSSTPLWQCIAAYAALFLLAAGVGWGGYKVLDLMGG